MYISYEPDCEGVYTLEEMEVLYKEQVYKTEYPDFDGWLYDMLRSGVLKKHRRRI